MKLLGVVISMSLFCGLGFGAASDTEQVTGDHVAHTKSEHVHGGPSCKHKKVKHGDHFDYSHDGQFHASHQEHYDNHGLVATADSSRSVATADDLKVTTHEHKHGADCGHKSIKHGDHLDYQHDDHFHATHTDHYDDHGPLAMKSE
jgi:hypothetical protein